MKVLLFGATGTAGNGILRACLASPAVEEVRVIVRRLLAISDPKLRVFIHSNFLDYTPVADAFANLDTCLYALGVAVSQTSGEAEYRTITHDYALAAARPLKARSPNAVLHFISGNGTRLDSRMMWARVKAETERDLPQIVDTVCWRPAFIDGSVNSGPLLYRALRPVFRLLSASRSLYVHSEDIGRAMLHATAQGRRSGILENREIRELAQLGM